MISLIAIVILSYIVGSFPTGIVFGKLFKGINVRQYGSKNMGATNVFRVLGAKLGISVLLLDMLKGLIATLIISGINLGDLSIAVHWLKIIAGFSAIFGHIFPVWIKFKGGKGIAAAAGVFFGLIPIEAGLAIMFFIIVVFFTRYVSLGSILASIFIPCALVVEKIYLGAPIHDSYMILAIILAVTVLITHRQNIKRLLRGEENKFGKKLKAFNVVNNE